MNRDLDCRIATEVFGWTDIKPKVGGLDWSGISPKMASHGGATRSEVPFYSTDMQDAKRVLDAWEGDIKLYRDEGCWIVEFPRETPDGWYIRGENGRNLAEVICRARLAVESKEQ